LLLTPSLLMIQANLASHIAAWRSRTGKKTAGAIS
jgi:hypothetical protein